MIAKKISETRKNRGLTQEELAEQSKINLRTIQRIENSKSEPRGTTLKLICDVLEIDMKEFISNDKPLNDNSLKEYTIGTKIVNGLFLLLLNFILMGIVGFLTLDSKANMNSVFGGFLLSFFLPFFIVFFTREMRKIERLLKFGSGYIAYFLMVVITPGFGTGFITGLFPCLLISLSVLFFGADLMGETELFFSKYFGLLIATNQRW